MTPRPATQVNGLAAEGAVEYELPELALEVGFHHVEALHSKFRQNALFCAGTQPAQKGGAMWKRARFLVEGLNLAHWLVAAGVPMIGAALLRATALPLPWLIVLGTGTGLTLAGLFLLHRNATTPWPRVFGWTVRDMKIPRTELVSAGGGSQLQERVREFPMEIASLDVANDPPGRAARATLRGATVELAFLNEQGGEPFLQVRGTWGSPPQNLRASRALLPNAEAHQIPLVIRHEGETDCYAAIPELWRSPDIRLPGQRITESTFFVRLAIRGTGLPKAKFDTVRVVNEAAEGLRVELLDTPEESLAPTSRTPVVSKRGGRDVPS